LWDNLRQHPHVRLPAAKELHYFDFNFHRGLDWYTHQFRNCVNHQTPVVVGEASPYYLFHPLAPARCSTLLPDAKIIAILRNPVDRAYSHYNHEIEIKQEWLSFEDALQAEPSRLRGELARLYDDQSYQSPAHIHHSYLARGEYVDQVKAWRRSFPAERFLLICFEEFFADPARQYERVQRFLGLPPVALEKTSEKNKLTYPKMVPSTREKLVVHFAPHNRRFYSFLNESWPAESVPAFSRYWEK
jgi:hypothetical protein